MDNFKYQNINTMNFNSIYGEDKLTQIFSTSDDRVVNKDIFILHDKIVIPCFSTVGLMNFTCNWFEEKYKENSEMYNCFSNINSNNVFNKLLELIICYGNKIDFIKKYFNPLYLDIKSQVDIGYLTDPNIFTYIGITAKEYPMTSFYILLVNELYIFIYYDGNNWRAYVPINGNAINPITKKIFWKEGINEKEENENFLDTGNLFKKRGLINKNCSLKEIYDFQENFYDDLSYDYISLDLAMKEFSSIIKINYAKLEL